MSTPFASTSRLIPTVGTHPSQKSPSTFRSIAQALREAPAIRIPHELVPAKPADHEMPFRVGCERARMPELLHFIDRLQPSDERIGRRPIGLALNARGSA